jgi:hypothetical protein
MKPGIQLVKFRPVIIWSLQFRKVVEDPAEFERAELPY